MPPPATKQAAARLWTAGASCSQLPLTHSDEVCGVATFCLHWGVESAGNANAVHMRACTGIKKCPKLRNRRKSYTCLYELFCLESHILSFPKVSQIPPESPCICIPGVFHATEEDNAAWLCESVTVAFISLLKLKFLAYLLNVTRRFVNVSFHMQMLCTSYLFNYCSWQLTAFTANVTPWAHGMAQARNRKTLQVSKESRAVCS